VITDLVKAGKVKHPYYDSNAKGALWVNDSNWLYKTDFNADVAPGERLWILFHGIDYESRGMVNGKEVFKHTGMFSRVFVDATTLVKKGTNTLEVELFGLGNLPNYHNFYLNEVAKQYIRRNTLKTQMSYGWDFAPELIGAGIWDRVEIFKTGPVMIHDISIKTKNSGEVSLDVSLDSSQAGKAILKVSIAPANFGDKQAVFEKDFPIDLSVGKSTTNPQILIPNPQLWWTVDMGNQNLYKLTAEVVVDGKSSDITNETFGFKEVVWEQNPGAPEGWKWVCKLNNKRVFLHGGNWVPPESLLGQLTNERYEKLLTMAADAHMNVFRVWGGGNRERDIFYDLADQKGIFLWQEFPLACVNIPRYPTSDKFLGLVEQEAGEIIRAIMNHPSVLLYSGGNEFNIQQNAKVVERMRKTVKSLDPSRRFIAASPAEGDSHNWIVWHQKGNLRDYFEDTHALMSEFGLQAFPPLADLEKYISADFRWPIGKLYEFHNLGTAKMLKYIRATPHEENLASYVEASEKMQAYYYQRATEHWRIRKYRVSGTLFWQFNEPWPAVCWSVVDYDLHPKAAYERIKDSYNPLLVAADLAVRGWKPGDAFSTDLYLVNDVDKQFSGLKIEARVAGQKVGEWSANSEPDSSVKIATLNTKLPVGSAPVLELFVWKGAEQVSHNLYDLSVYDPVDSGAAMRQLNKVYDKLVYGEKKKGEEE
jgi:beta-mannosidase